jgi:hypothetical protein
MKLWWATRKKLHIFKSPYTEISSHLHVTAAFTLMKSLTCLLDMMMKKQWRFHGELNVVRPDGSDLSMYTRPEQVGRPFIEATN